MDFQKIRSFILSDQFLPFSLVIVTLLVFSNAIPHPFVHDDIFYIVLNPQISHLDHLTDLFFRVIDSAPKGSGGNVFYRPLLEIFYRLEYFCFGFNAAMFHLVNILIHILNGLLLFTLLRRLQFSQISAFFVSLLFLIHPVQTEAVDAVVGISNLLSTLFVLLALNYYVQEKFVYSLAVLVAAFFTKEQVVVTPLLFILLDWYQNKKGRESWWLLSFALTAYFMWLRSVITHAHMLENIFQPGGSPGLRFLSIPRTILMYLRLIILPDDLHYYRNTDLLKPNLNGFIVLGVIGLFLSILVQKWRQGKGAIILGLGLFIVCLLPVSNILPMFNEGSLMFTPEHFLYFPIVGVLLVLAALVRIIGAPRLLLWVAIFVSLLFGVVTVIQNNYWRSSVALFERTVAFEPGFSRGHILLAEAYFLNHQEIKAVAEYDQALSIMKGYQSYYTDNVGRRFVSSFMNMIYAEKGECLQNAALYHQAILSYEEALKFNPNEVGLLDYEAVCYVKMGEKAKAKQILMKAFLIDPNFMPVRENLSQFR